MRRTEAQTRCGLIEIGTNSVKCLIVDVTRRRPATVYFSKKTTRIGEGLKIDRRISKEALARSLEVIDTFGRKTRRARCDHVFCFSTYALRRARNSTDAVRKIERRVGYSIRVLSGREEARFAYISARAHLGRGRPNTVVLDIGGGSTELVVARKGRIAAARSLPIGALHLTERFVHDDPIGEEALSRMTHHLAQKLGSAFRSAGVDTDPPNTFDLVGSGGTVTSAAQMIDRPTRIRSADLRALLQRCSALPLARRRRLRGLEPDRADIIIAGLSVLAQALRLCNKRVLLVNPGGVRTGVLFHLIERGFRW